MDESEIIKELLQFIQNCPAQTGVCMCGLEIDKHDIYADHYGLDQYEYSVTYFMEKYKTYLESPHSVCQAHKPD